MNIELNYKLIGMRLRSIRKKRGYTQEQLSERAGISAQHCSGIECGSAKVSLPALVRLCNAVEATPDELLMDSIEQVTPSFSKKIAAVFSDCSTDEMYLMLSQAKNLKEGLRAKSILSRE